MNTIDKELELSYQMQRENFSRKNVDYDRLHTTWLRDDTVDNWRHQRGFMPLKALLDGNPGSTWLTVGDGRFGLDSIRLKKIQPTISVLPTDIAPELLSQAKESKLIDDYRTENAESLSFSNDSFDFSFCKEAYHHFPRPYIALYEMLRVSRKGVVLVEPNEKKEYAIPEKVWRFTKDRIKQLLGRTVPHPETWSFEESGNFIYSVSKNEIEKVALGLRIPTVAFYYYNDYYEEGVEYEPAIPGNPLFEKVKKKISQADLRSRLGLRAYSSIIAVLFKQLPDKALRNELEQTGFSFVDLPENPYLKKRSDQLS